MALFSCLLFGGLVVARYATWHSFVLDLGSYDQKVWRVSIQATWWEMLQQTYAGGVKESRCGTWRYWGICHFQPLHLIPGLIYKAWPSPVLLLAIQVLVVVSGVWPAFLLFRDALGGARSGVLGAALFLTYPAVQFNAVLDFRPDFVAIPALLWAFWLAERGRLLAAVLVAAAMGLMKETLFLTLAFFGLFVWCRYRRPAVGVPTCVAGAVLFYFVAFHVLSFEGRSEGWAMLNRYFPDVSQPLESGSLPSALRDPGSFVAHVARPLKLVYLAALFGPLACLPLLSPLALVPALPSLVTSLLSVDPTHASIQSQYSASVVGPALFALPGSIERLRARLGISTPPVALLAGVVMLSASVSLALGPTPLSINFWDQRWGGHWHYTQYVPDRQEVLNRAERLIPEDPNVAVVTQNGLNSARLAHRHAYYAFPNRLDRADYVFLDARRLPFVYWTPEPGRYGDLVRGLRENPDWRVIFDEDGALVFRRERR